MRFRFVAGFSTGSLGGVMREHVALAELIAVWFLKALGVVLIILYFALLLVPFFGVYVAIRTFVPSGGHPLAMGAAMVVMFFLWWLSLRPRVKRANAAFEYLVNSCLKNDQPWRFPK
jgi:hypothetical protein